MAGVLCGFSGERNVRLVSISRFTNVPALIGTPVLQDKGRDAVTPLAEATLPVHRNAVGFGRLLGMPLVTYSDAPLIG